jgi:uncharacterized membrane protein
MRPTTPPEFVHKVKASTQHLTLKDLLQGKPFGHPAHSFLVHLPTALWPTALVFDILAYAKHGTNLALTLTAWWCILIGLITALAAIPTGIADWTSIHPGRPARKLGLLHAALNTAVFGLFVANFTLRCMQGPLASSITGTELALSTIAVALLVPSGYLGGLLVYDHGIGVARTSKQYWRKVAIAGGAKLTED